VPCSSTWGRGPSPSAREGALGELATSPSVGTWLSGKRSPSPTPSARAWHSGTTFFQFFGERLRPMVPSNATFLFRVPSFPECCTQERLPSRSAALLRVSCASRHSGKPPFPECNTSPSATLGEDLLPRVPEIWQSGKRVALGKFSFSRSGSSGKV
jgi:hypothetical protein